MQRVALPISNYSPDFVSLLFTIHIMNEPQPRRKKKPRDTTWSPSDHRMMPSTRTRSLCANIYIAQKKSAEDGETDGGTERERGESGWLRMKGEYVGYVFKLLFGCAWNMIMSVTYVKSILWQFLYNSHLHISPLGSYDVGVLSVAVAHFRHPATLYLKPRKTTWQIEFWLLQ